jgi:hypothetical protein
MKQVASWDETPYSLLKVIRPFGGMYEYVLHLQDRISRAKNQHEESSKLCREDRTLHNHNYEKLGFYVTKFYSRNRY